jgi:anaerobic selenocysteine-containing dehydrogenase
VAEDAFVEKETSGLVKWWNLELKDRTPAFGEKESGIPAAQIVRVARAMGKAAPKTAVWMGPGVAMWPRGTYAAMAVHALNGLLGSIDVEGGVWEGASGPPLAKFPSTDKFIDEVAKKGYKNHVTSSRGHKDMPGLQVAPINDVPNVPVEEPRCDQDGDLLMEQLQSLRYRRRPLEPGDGQGALLRAHGHQPVGNDPVRRHRAALHAQFLRRLVHRHQHVQRLWLRLDPAEPDQARVRGQAGRNRSHVAAGPEAEGQGLPQPGRLLRPDQGPETGKSATNELEFSEFAAKVTSAPIWMAKEPLKGDAPINGWAEFKARGMFSGPKYTLKKGWGGKFKTETKKFEFYSATLKKMLTAHATKHATTTDDILTVSGYTARGDLAFVPHYEVPKRHGSFEEYPFTFIDYKSRLNREGRSQNLPWYQEFKKVDPGDVSWGDVVKMNPADGAKLGLKTGDKVTITSQAGSITVDLKLWEGVRPGTVAKCYGQGHWAYGRVASKDYAKSVPLGGNNNEILVDDYDRLSGATARNGGFTGVRITKA